MTFDSILEAMAVLAQAGLRGPVALTIPSGAFDALLNDSATLRRFDETPAPLVVNKVEFNSFIGLVTVQRGPR